jgi:2-methylisocitrate lyase-like PEP mutase family enzyme
MLNPQSLKARIANTGAGPLLLPGAPNALTARVIEELGFEAVYLSGAGISNSFLAMPDIGLLTMTEIVAHVAAVREAVQIPIVVDGDTGFGNAVNVRRTVREYGRAGANAMQLEDQVSPKKCGHFEGKGIISLAEMVGKIHSVVDSRLDDDFLLIARTDARAISGIDEACDRASRFLEEGADIAFVEAPTTREELAMIPQRVGGPLLVNIVEGAKTPPLSVAELGEMGFDIVLYANTAMRAAVVGMQRVLESLKTNGGTTEVLEDILGWESRQNLVRKPLYDELDTRYGNAVTS